MMPVQPLRVEPPEIICKVVLLIEGDDEARFFEALLKHVGLVPNVDIQLRKLEGKDNRRAFEAFLRDPGFPIVTAYAIVRDADADVKDTLKSIQKLLRDHGQPCPKGHGMFAHNDTLKVGIFIMPGNTPSGMLEDLCLQSVADHPIMPHVEDFMAQVKSVMQEKAPKNESKAKVQAFLAGMEKPLPHLGVAAQKGYWPFNREAFSSLCDFIEQLMLPLEAESKAPGA